MPCRVAHCLAFVSLPVGLVFADPPPAETLKLPVTRDLWVSNVGQEIHGNNGGSGKLKLKSNQEMSLIDIDPAPLKGRTVLSATLHLRSAGEPRLKRVTVSSISADWTEGTASNYEKQDGASTFAHRRHPKEPWAYPGSDLMAVTLGQGGTVWRMAEATPPDKDGWQTVAVDPAVIAARVAGVGKGFLVFDDTGSEWSREGPGGEKWVFRLFPNRFVHSREGGSARAPYITVALGPADNKPPAAPSDPKADAAGLPAGEADVSWTVPADEGPAGVAGFLGELDGKPLPQYLMPAPAAAGKRVTTRLRDLGLKPGQAVELSIKAVDGAGNVGAAASLKLTVSAEAVAELPGKPAELFAEPAPLPKLGDAEVAVIDTLDKVHPLTGAMIPPPPPTAHGGKADDYLSANHLFSAKAGLVRLHAAKGEIVDFQVLLRGAVAGVVPTLEFPKLPAAKAGFGRLALIPTAAGPMPDAVVPLAGRPFAVPTPEDKIDKQKTGSLLAEFQVPATTPAGDYEGTLRLAAGDKSLELKVTLRVWDFALPDVLSFVPEMNGYGLPVGPDKERDWYRLAHRHRTVLNIVPYSQRGEVYPGAAPRRDAAGKWDWSAWDARYGPLLDGSAFADLPRAGVPLDALYLPLNENWPEPINDKTYNNGYWADEAFTPAYRQGFVEGSREFAAHVAARGWRGTRFQLFLNGKNDFKQRGWSRGSSPWLLDEPSNFQDYWALKWFGEAFHEGARAAMKDVPPGKRPALVYRIDVSRPQWQRDSLDGVMDYPVVAGGSFIEYHRLVMDRNERLGQTVLVYGGTNAPEAANTQAVGWCIDTWSAGGDGVVPWLTVGSDRSWQKGEDTCLLYPGGPAGSAGPVPSVRLKAYLRGEQDVEYLTLLARATNRPRWAVGSAVRKALGLKAVRQGTGWTGAEDAGIVTFAKLTPADLWSLRVRLGEALSALKPPPARQLVEFRYPERDGSAASPGHIGKPRADR